MCWKLFENGIQKGFHCLLENCNTLGKTKLLWTDRIDILILFLNYFKKILSGISQMLFTSTSVIFCGQLGTVELAACSLSSVVNKFFLKIICLNCEFNQNTLWLKKVNKCHCFCSVLWIRNGMRYLFSSSNWKLAYLRIY